MSPRQTSGTFSNSTCFLLLASLLLSCTFLAPAAAQSCGSQGVAVQVLGSGGPELQDKRASSSYLVWEKGQARVLIDAGGGSALRFGESGAQMSQLDVLLFTHFHVDHSADFPALIFSSWFENRERPLPIYGPPGNDFMPSTTEFVSNLFGEKHGAYRYLSELLEPGEIRWLQNAAPQRDRELNARGCISQRRSCRLCGARFSWGSPGISLARRGWRQGYRV